jgi:hypothetical protein
MAAVAADFYKRVLGSKSCQSATEVTSAAVVFSDADYEAPQLFIDAQKTFLESALWLNRHKKSLTDAEHAQMMAIADSNCYRASKYLIPWGKIGEPTVEQVAAWTTKLFEWVQSDQDFFVPLLKKLAGMEED